MGMEVRWQLPHRICRAELGGARASWQSCLAECKPACRCACRMLHSVCNVCAPCLFVFPTRRHWRFAPPIHLACMQQAECMLQREATGPARQVTGRPCQRCCPRPPRSNALNMPLVGLCCPYDGHRSAFAFANLHVQLLLLKLSGAGARVHACQLLPSVRRKGKGQATKKKLIRCLDLPSPRSRIHGAWCQSRSRKGNKLGNLR